VGRKEDIFYQVSQFAKPNTPDTIQLGEVEPKDFAEVVEEVMEEYCHYAYNAIANEKNAQIQAETIHLLCMSPSEFYELHRQSITEVERNTYYNDIYSKHKLNIRKNGRYKADFKSYWTYLQENFKQIKVVQFFFWKFPVALSLKDLQGHSLITARTKSGKSGLLEVLINQLLELDQNDCIILIDPHGDVANKVARLKSAGKRHIAYFNPFLSDELFPCLNPFDVVLNNEYEIDIYTQVITKIFTEMFKDNAMSRQMDTILKPCISTLLKKGGSSLFELVKFMDDTCNKDLVELGKQISTNPVHIHCFENTFYQSNYTATKQGIMIRIQDLLNSTIFLETTCNKTTFNFEKEINRKNLLIFNLSKGETGFGTSNILGRLIVTMIQITAMRRAKIPKHKRMATYFFIDECHNYVSDGLKEILEEANKYTLYLTLSHQYIGQMDTDLTNSIKSNVSNIFTGRNSTDKLAIIARETREDLDKLLDLKRYQFALKTLERPSFVFTVPSTLVGDKGSISAEEWERTRKPAIIREYYKVPKNESGTKKMSLEDLAKFRNNPQGKNNTPADEPLIPYFGR